MAIAYDNGTYGQFATASSLTFAHTTSGSNRILFVGGYDTNSSGGSTLVTGITYNAVAMTFAVTKNYSATQNDRALVMYYLVAPATGSNNVVVTLSSSTIVRHNAMSYTGAKQTSPLNGTNTAGATAVTSISVAITTTVANDWMLLVGKDNTGSKTYTSSTGDTVRYSADAGGTFVVDTGAAITPAGSNTMTQGPTTGSLNLGVIAVAFQPATATSITSVDGVAQASITSVLGIANASIASINGIANS